MKKTLLFLILSLSCSVVFSAVLPSIKGVVVDKRNGEPLIGATVVLKSKSKAPIATAAGLDGSFVFRNVPAGEYELEFKYVSYQKTEVHFSLKEGESRTFNIKMEPKGADLSEVNIKAKADGGSEVVSRRVEQLSNQVVNVVSAKAIEVSPDITVANVMQRVSGVSVERANNGEAQYPIIRGMEKRYISTLVNGVKIPSPDNKNRYVPLDIFPADIVDRLEIYKSLTPSLEADAIGGAVNLVLKDAPDRLTINANLATGAQSLSNSSFTTFDHSASAAKSPRIVNGNSYIATNADFTTAPFKLNSNNNSVLKINGTDLINVSAPLSAIMGLTVGDRVANGKLGILASVSYQNTFRSTNTTYFGTDVDLNNGQPTLSDIDSRTYSTQQKRVGLHTKFDYKVNTNNKLDLYAAYMNLSQNLYRTSSDTDLTLGRTAIGTGRVKQNLRSDRTIQQIYNLTLKGDHKLTDMLHADWSLVYSKATADEPDRATISISRGVAPTGAQITPAYDALTGVTHVWANNSDRDKAAYLNLSYSPKIMSTPVEFSAGGMFRDKSRHSNYDVYNFRPNPANEPVADDINNATFTLFNTQGTSDNALNYDFTEKVGAYYGQFKFTAGKLQTIGGVRAEYTRQNWLTAAGPKVLGTEGHIQYYDVLPSIGFKYMLNSKQNLRLTYYSAVSRPGFYELVPHTGGDPDADYTEIGNPNLKRVTADNYDLRYEFFPKGLDQLLVGVFYKRLNNPIEFAVEPTGAGATGYVLKSDNFGVGHNYGFELDVAKYVRNFGIKANYTFTNSEITTSKRVLYRDAAGFQTQRFENQTRPLQGQSKHIGNVAFLYKDPKKALDMQLAMVYTGARINTVSTDLDNDIWQKGFVQLDFSAEKRFGHSHFYGYVKANNLLNTPFELEVRRPYTPASTTVPVEMQTVGKNVFVRKDQYGQNYIIGLRYKL